MGIEGDVRDKSHFHNLLTASQPVAREIAVTAPSHCGGARLCRASELVSDVAAVVHLATATRRSSALRTIPSLVLLA
jgi:hypothetical protein